MNDEPEKVAREQPNYMARIQSATKSLIRNPEELNLPTISVEFDNSLSSLIPKHGELLEGENGLGELKRLSKLHAVILCTPPPNLSISNNEQNTSSCNNAKCY